MERDWRNFESRGRALPSCRTRSRDRSGSDSSTCSWKFGDICQIRKRNYIVAEMLERKRCVRSSEWEKKLFKGVLLVLNVSTSHSLARAMCFFNFGRLSGFFFESST